MALSKGHPFEIQVEAVPVNCFRCGQPCKKVLIEKGTRTPRKLCSECLELGENGIAGEVHCREQLKGLNLRSRIEWRQLKKGSREFKKAAAEIMQRRQESLQGYG